MGSDSALTDLVSRLEQRLRDQAWHLVDLIIRAELQRRASFVSQSLDHAFDAALATRQPAPPVPGATSPAPAAAPPIERHALVEDVRERQLPTDSFVTGVVKWFNETKGFGFIRAADGGDVFVHYKHLGGDGFRTLDEGQLVAYREHSGPRGRFATDVRPA